MTYEAQNVALRNQVLSERITPSTPEKQMKTSEQINELAAALAAAQGMMENAVMNRINPHFKSKYADLAAIFDAARKPLSANGLAIVQTIGDGVLHTRLLHTSGQWIASEHPLPMSGRPQEIGSALTYARRYSLSALIGIAADEDDDATAAERHTRATATSRPSGWPMQRSVSWKTLSKTAAEPSNGSANLPTLT